MADLENGRRFYNEQAPGLGQYFVDSLFSDIESLELYAGVQSVHFGYHRLLSKRFPYGIYYRVNEGMVEIWRVLDARQHPRKIKRALR